MAAANQRKPKIKDLGLSSDQLKLAKKFASDIGIGTNDDLHYFAVLWYRDNVKSNGDVLSATKQKRFVKELERRSKSKQYLGTITKEILGEITLLSLQEQTDKDLLSQTAPETAGQVRSTTTRVTRRTQPTRPERPKVTITIDKNEVEKGGSYTVTWKSENANFVSRSTQFDPPLQDIELSGSRTITANRVGSKTFSITVRSLTGASASARATINIVAVRDTSQQSQQQPSGQQQTTQTRRPRTTTTRVTRSSLRNSDSQLLNSINRSLKNIVDILENQAGIIRAVERGRRREAENQRRRKREGILEMAKGAGGLLVEKALTPIKSIFEKIWRFIFFTLLGRVFTEFLNWFNDPKNKDKVKTLSRFIKDNFWLLIGGAALYFLTPFGGFINSLLGKLAWYTTKLIAKKVLLNPKLLVIAALTAGLVFAANKYRNSQLKKDEERRKVVEQAYDPKNYGSGKTAEIRQLSWWDKFRLEAAEFMNPGGRRFDSGGYVTTQTGSKIKGAGTDTQLTALTPGEIVMNRSAVDAVGAGNLLALNKMYGGPNANNPKKLGNIFGMSGGGMVGDKNPKISDADYNALLAITSAEDFANPQGRADVAQALYNRLFATRKYKENFAPTGGRNTLKDLITGPGQFEPTFKNRDDWLNITDRNSAAAAFAKYKKIPVTQALKILNETDQILRNPVYQQRAANHVRGRTFFLGTSQHKNMKPEKGDVLRGKTHNFFSHWYTEDSKYRKEMGHIAAPLPANLVVSKPEPPKQQSQGFKFPNLRNLFPSASKPAAAAPKKPTAPKATRLNVIPYSKPQQERPWWDPRGWMGKKGGGSVDNGLHITSNMFSIPGLTEDRFPILAQQGEYVVPKLTVQKIGLQFFNNLVSATDSNSEAAKLSPIPRREELLPPMSSSPSMAQIMTLPPIMNGSGMAPQSTPATSSQIPSFPAVSPQASNTRSYLSEIYNIA